MIRADLHMHSTVSDGSFTIPELIARARQNGLDVIAITDHDTLSQRFQIPADTGLQVLTGIEISAYDYENDFRVHMLGYGIQKPEVTEQAVHPTLEARHANSLKQIEILNQHGYEIDLSQLRRADGKYIYKQHIMDDLVRRGKAPDMFGEFYQKTFKHGGICDFDLRRWRHSVPLRMPAIWRFWRTAVSSRTSALSRSWQNRGWTDWNSTTTQTAKKTGKSSGHMLRSTTCFSQAAATFTASSRAFW